MTPLLFTMMLATTNPPTTAPTTTTTAATTAPTPAATTAPAQKASTGFAQMGSATSGGSTLPAVALLVLGSGAAAVFGMKKKKKTRAINVVDAVGVGRGRSVVVLEIDGKRLVLGSSEAGVVLLGEPTAALAASAPTTSASALSIPALFGRFRDNSGASARLELDADDDKSARRNGEPAFTVDLGDSDEGEALRRKISARRNGNGGRGL